MNPTQKNTIDRFIDRQKQRVADKQKEIAKKGLNYLFAFSPHYTGNAYHYSYSQYDANHKLSINGGAVSAHIPPTMSMETSKQFVNLEKQKADQIECGDEIVLTNSTPHKMAVEYGKLVSATWGIPGYRPVSKTLNQLKEEFRNVLE